MYISKSRYTLFCKCEKAFWLDVFKPEKATPIDTAQQKLLDEGVEVGNYAKKRYVGGLDVTTIKDDSLDLDAMVSKTKEAMRKGVSTIYEASFSFNGNYCAVDILRKTGDGWDIYEVKSTSYSKSNGKPTDVKQYASDVAYQKWLLEQCGVKVTGVHLVCLNSDYVRHGALDLEQLFIDVKDFDKVIADEYARVSENIVKASDALKLSTEPVKELGKNCFRPYLCSFWQYCKQQKGLPEPSVFDVYGGNINSKGSDRFFIDNKLQNYYAGRVSFNDLKSQPLGRIQRIQIEGKEFVDKEGIRAFLKTLSGPLYFLDFESMMFPIPQFDGTKPYQQVTFQYSLHIMDDKSGAIEHREFLAPSDGNSPLRAVAEQLCNDIPVNVCVLAYNKIFECERIEEMANLFNDLKSHLLNIKNNIKDLLDPFQAGYYYLPAMGGSFSIKSVLPALFPDDPKLNYHNLPGSVHNGGEAMTIFPKIKDMSPSDAAAARKSLLEYCCLDTWAMVKVLGALRCVDYHEKGKNNSE